MSKQIRELKARKAALIDQASAINAAAAAANRDLDDTELSHFDALKAQIEGLNRKIEAAQFLIEQQAALGVEVPDGVIRVSENLENDPRRGFGHFGEFALAVKQASQRNGIVDQRLQIGAAAPTTFGSEGIGGDGGFSIPPGYSTEIWTNALEQESLVPYTDNTDVSGNGMVFPSDETTPWGTDGIRAYWQGEALAGTQTKPKLRAETMRLHKLMALVPITDELLADSVAIGSYLTNKLPISIRWKTDEAILFGTGVGQPQGALVGNAAIVVAKESGQATQTLQALNLANMMARLPAGSFGKSIWLINNNVLPALFTLTLGNYPIYLPAVGAGAMQGNPYGLLLGRPIIVSQHAKSFSAQGDVCLLDLSYYRTITKAEGIKTDMSLHLYFDADAAAFRATYRIDGQPAIVNPIPPQNGSTNMSPFVQLGAR